MASLGDSPVGRAAGSGPANVAEEARLEHIMPDQQVVPGVVAVQMLIMLCYTVLCSDVMCCLWLAIGFADALLLLQLVLHLVGSSGCLARLLWHAMCPTQRDVSYASLNRVCFGSRHCKARCLAWRRYTCCYDKAVMMKSETAISLECKHPLVYVFRYSTVCLSGPPQLLHSTPGEHSWQGPVGSAEAG